MKDKIDWQRIPEEYLTGKKKLCGFTANGSEYITVTVWPTLIQKLSMLRQLE